MNVSACEHVEINENISTIAGFSIFATSRLRIKNKELHAVTRATISALAAENHIARSVALRHLNDAGIFRDPNDKTFDHDEASAAIKLRLDEDRINGNRVAGRASNGNSLDDEARRALNRSKAEAEQMRARKMRLQLEQAEGRLVEREAVEAVCRDIATRARSAFLSIGSKLAPRLAGMTDERQIRALIDQEAVAALGVLADPETFDKEALS
ncbi:hypothetical protein M2323_002745 [Rhodoblastus acidophilus]|uniref:hypothetical protein n=1 Tax=Rhodoblastus acidophilus TaxID=1074 RepID=UPI002223F4CB|nr:hypothetical protein [Rhodoblastus acidophilus]MCW2284901.1 hypothetical protein [Rhodoblastus acidophilus]MCW2333809.1 hypothetical protein [Rhodoblastus acidophilus]